MNISETRTKYMYILFSLVLLFETALFFVSTSMPLLRGFRQAKAAYIQKHGLVVIFKEEYLIARSMAKSMPLSISLGAGENNIPWLMNYYLYPRKIYVFYPGRMKSTKAWIKEKNITYLYEPGRK